MAAVTGRGRAALETKLSWQMRREEEVAMRSSRLWRGEGLPRVDLIGERGQAWLITGLTTG